MITPPPETPIAGETLEEIAARVARNLCLKAEEPQQFQRVKSSVLSALCNERESQARKADEKAQALRRAIQLRKFPNDCELRIAETAIMVADDIARSIRKG